MAQLIKAALNSIPSGSRDLVEFNFYCDVGFTAANVGQILRLDLFILIQ